MSLYKSAGLNALGASDVPAGGLLGRCGENLENLAAMCVCIYIEYTYIHIEREREIDIVKVAFPQRICSG